MLEGEEQDRTADGGQTSALDTLPELEKFVDVDEQVLADDYSSSGSTTLEIATKYCRDCHVASQRLYHVESLSSVCETLEDEQAFPIDLITELAEDDDNDVRKSVASQLGAFATCVRRLGGRLDHINAIKLLGVMFMLIEDDCEEVIESAESACVHVAALLSPDKQRTLLVPTLNSFAGSEEEEIRISAANTLGRLASIVNVEVTKVEILPTLLSLADDDEFRVRQVAAPALCEILKVLDDENKLALVLPSLSKLSKDAVWAVRASCAKQVVHIVKAVSRDRMLEVASDMFEPLANDVSFNVRTAALEQLGPLIFELSAVEVPVIFVDYFTSMAESATSNSTLQQTCAYNLPGVVLSLTSARWPELRQAFQLLAGSLNWRVRRTLGCSLHEIAKIIGREHTERDILPTVEKLLEDTDDVKIGVIEHLSDILAIIGSPSRLSLMRLLSTFNSDEHEKIGNWRIRYAMAEQMLPTSRLLSGTATAEFIIPVLMTYLDDAASVVREKAVAVVGEVLAHAATELSWYSNEIVNALSTIKRLATSHRWSDRRAYIHICLSLAMEVDQRLVVDELLPLLVMLAEDPVTSVKTTLGAFLEDVLKHDPTYTTLPDINAAIDILKADSIPELVQIALRCEAHATLPTNEKELTSTHDVRFAPTGL